MFGVGIVGRRGGGDGGDFFGGGFVLEIRGPAAEEFGAVGAGGGFARLPFAGGLGEGAGPFAAEGRPLDAGREEEENHDGEPDGGHGVEIAEERASAGRETGEQKSSHSEGPRPPEVEAGNEEDKRPARGEFDEELAGETGEKRAVEIVENAHGARGVGDGAGDRSGGGIDEDGKFSGAGAELHLGGATGAGGGNELGRGEFWKGGAGGGELGVGREKL